MTIGIAVWISIFVNRNFTTLRAVKGYFITEYQGIRDQYNFFLETVYNNKFKPNEVQEWFKIMTMRIDVFEEYLKKEFKVHPKLLKHHNKIKVLITGSEELNANYKSETFALLTETRTELHKIHKDFNSCQTKLVIDINKASRK